MRSNVETEIIVRYEGDPEVPAIAGEALGNEEVNIFGYACHATQGSGLVRFLTDEPGRAESVLEDVGLTSTQRKVLVTPAPNEPGSFGRVARRLFAQGLAVSESYLVLDPSGTMPRLAFAIEGADEALEKAAAKLRS